MRSNGLTAPAYTPVADLEPMLATALLNDLKEQGVAAYAKPVEASTTSGFDRPEFRLGVRERLYVDASAYGRVRDLLSERDPDLIDDNEDLTWAQIVAGFDRPLDAQVAPWPAQEDLAAEGAEDQRAEPAAPAGPGGDGALPVIDRRNQVSGLGRRPAADDAPEQSVELPRDDTGPARTEAFDDADFLASTSKTTSRDGDGFVPDPPPPLPKLAPYKQAAWLGVVGGPLLLLVVAIFGLVVPGWLAFLGVVGFVGGFITLVATMGDRDDGEWGSDDGAVV